MVNRSAEHTSTLDRLYVICYNSICNYILIILYIHQYLICNYLNIAPYLNRLLTLRVARKQHIFFFLEKLIAVMISN